MAGDSSTKLASPLDRVRVVLVQTSHTGNMGAAARAMKTMGLNRLYLVRPRSPPDEQAEAMASAATDVLAQARLCSSLDEALAGTTLAIAFTARSRDLSHRSSTVREAAELAAQTAAGSEVALVFGPESSGLSNEDVLKCQRIAHIPANPEYSSLNLAAAVQVACYELRIAAESQPAPAGTAPRLARFEEVERLYQQVENTLLEVRFLNAEYPKRLMTRIRRVFARAALEHEEVQVLRGMMKMISRALKRNP